MDELKYIIVGKTAYISKFYGDFSELVSRLDIGVLNTFELLEVKNICWGVEGEQFEELENFPRLET